MVGGSLTGRLGGGGGGGGWPPPPPPPQQPNTQPLRFAGASPIGFLHIWLRLGEYMLVVSQERHRLAGLFSEGKYRLYRRIRTMAYSRRRGLKPAHLDCCSVFEAYQFEGHGGTQE